MCFLLIALAILAVACDATVDLPTPSSLAPAPVTVPVDRASPEAAVRTFLLHMKAGDCEGFLSDLTTIEAAEVISKAGGREQLCTRVRSVLRDFANTVDARDVLKQSEKDGKAVVAMTVRDGAGRDEKTTVSLMLEGTDWKVSQFAP